RRPPAMARRPGGRDRARARRGDGAPGHGSNTHGQRHEDRGLVGDGRGRGGRVDARRHAGAGSAGAGGDARRPRGDGERRGRAVISTRRMVVDFDSSSTTSFSTLDATTELTMAAGLHPYAVFGDWLVAAPRPEATAATVLAERVGLLDSYVRVMGDARLQIEL